MQYLRVVVRLLLATIWTLLLIVPYAIGNVVLFWSPAGRVPLRGWIVHLWARGLSFLFGMRIRTLGTPPLPPFCLVTNHLSYLDILLIASRVRTAFISRGDVRAWPVVGFLTRVGGTVFINRADRKDIVRVMNEMEVLFARGGSVTFFPEATTSKGDAVYAFKPPLLELPARMGLSVAYAALSYRTPPGQLPAGDILCWGSSVPFAHHVLRVLRLPHFEAFIDFGPDLVRSSDRKELARVLEGAVRKRFQPVAGFEPATETPAPSPA